MFRLLSDPKLIEVLREEIDRLGELTYENYKVSEISSLHLMWSSTDVFLSDLRSLYKSMLLSTRGSVCSESSFHPRISSPR